MLSDENINIIDNEIEIMQGMNAGLDNELFVMRVMRDKLHSLGFGKGQSSISSSMANITIDFDISVEEDKEKVTEYIENYTEFTLRRALYLTNYGNNEDEYDDYYDNVIECFNNIIKNSQINLV